MNQFEKFFHNYSPGNLSAMRSYVAQQCPSVLEERELHVTQMDVFSRLMLERKIYFASEVSDVTCSIVNAQLLYLESVDPEAPISMYIDSPGGMIASGGLIASAIHHCKGTVKTVARGLCASAAALIHSAAKPENTSVSPMAVMLYHMSSHSDMGVSTGISARAKNQVKYVNETLLVKAKEDGHITDAEYARIQAGEDIIVPADEWNKRTHKENN